MDCPTAPKCRIERLEMQDLRRGFDDGVLWKIANLDRASFPDPWTADDWTRILDSWDGKITIARTPAADVLGYVATAQRKKGVEILRVAVESGVRRRGVGSALVWSVSSAASMKQSNEYVVAYVDDHDDASIRLFSKMGFRAAKPIRGYFGPDRDAYVFAYGRHPKVAASPIQKGKAKR